MARYHINHRGEAGLCKAQRKCPFGDLATDHFDSPEEARAAYELKASQLPTASEFEVLEEALERAAKGFTAERDALQLEEDFNFQEDEELETIESQLYDAALYLKALQRAGTFDKAVEAQMAASPVAIFTTQRAYGALSALDGACDILQNEIVHGNDSHGQQAKDHASLQKISQLLGTFVEKFNAKNNITY